PTTDPKTNAYRTRGRTLVTQRHLRWECRNKVARQLVRSESPRATYSNKASCCIPIDLRAARCGQLVRVTYVAESDKRLIREELLPSEQRQPPCNVYVRTAKH